MKINNITNCAKLLFNLKLNAESLDELDEAFRPENIKGSRNFF